MAKHLQAGSCYWFVRFPWTSHSCWEQITSGSCMWSVSMLRAQILSWCPPSLDHLEFLNSPFILENGHRTSVVVTTPEVCLGTSYDTNNLPQLMCMIDVFLASQLVSSYRRFLRSVLEALHLEPKMLCLSSSSSAFKWVLNSCVSSWNI